MLKLYAWEPSFEQQVLDIRSQEIRVLRKTAYLNAGTSFIWTCAPFVVGVWGSVCSPGSEWGNKGRVK